MLDGIRLCAVVAALATTLTGEALGQSTGTAGVASPAPAGSPALSSGTAVGQPGIATPAPARGGAGALTPGANTTDAARTRDDPTRAQNQTPASTQQPQGPASTRPSSARGLAAGAAAQGNNQTTTDAASTGSGVTGGVPAMNGITPGRAELPASAFTKLDAANRGYLTLEDVRQLDGFQSAFREGDQNGDGRLNASEFNSAWGVYSGNVR